MSAATKKAIEEIESLSEKVTQDPNALGNKLRAERKLYKELLNKGLATLRAVNYSGWLHLSYNHVGCFVPTGKISVYGGGGNRNVDDLITHPGDFDRLVQTLNVNVKHIVASCQSPA